MSELNLKSYSWLAAKELSYSVDDGLAQASLGQSVAKCSVSVSEEETREHAQSERIDQLEQALEQSLTSLNELRQKLKDQQILETQLAVTEEIANLQQKAITQLKQQLAQQQQSLNVQTPKTKRTQFFQVELPTFQPYLSAGSDLLFLSRVVYATTLPPVTTKANAEGTSGTQLPWMIRPKLAPDKTPIAVTPASPKRRGCWMRHTNIPPKTDQQKTHKASLQAGQTDNRGRPSKTALSTAHH